MDRVGDEVVEGCWGEGITGISYCRDAPPLVNLGDNPDTSIAKLALCEGDCDSDEDCEVCDWRRLSGRFVRR